VHAPPRPQRRWPRRALVTLAVLVAVLAGAGGALWLLARDALGGRVEGARLARVERSPQWRGGAFRNRRRRVDAPATRMLGAFLFGGSDHRDPDAPLPVARRRGAEYATPPASGLRVTWLGHSTLLLEIDGRRVLVDPVWGERTSPLTFVGPRRFYAPPLPLAELPAVDVVVISHDHYDHLDTPTIRALAARGARFAVPLGVGAHLQAWGVAATRIAELDWWDTTHVAGLTLTATPARHFSGRGLDDAGRTLWAGWVVAGPRHRVYYSGDTALDDAMVDIGARLGPFDLTMIEVGAYDALWPDVHLGPEQAVRAHQLVRGGVLLPVHWGLFDLALHGWTEPIERVLVAARAAGVPVATPRPGDRVEPASLAAPVRWWPAVPWRTAREAPAFSTGVAHLLREGAPAAAP
jgi:L-ascorbate metabolism protein UlaG (beta-lactamase superfamily)